MTREERAKIARENGAKSHGPKTQSGKAASSRNAIKSGEHATKLAMFVPPHSAVLCNEERQDYARLVEELLAVYLPVNEVARSIVRTIAIARWEIERLRACVTMHWNVALVDNAELPSKLDPELLEMHAMIRASAQLYGSKGTVRELNRQIDSLELRIARSERRLDLIHRKFANPDQKPQPVENTDPKSEETPKNTENEPPVYVTENTPEVIHAYKTLYPGRRIIVLPPDNVAKGIETDDDLPQAPRKAA